MTKSDIAAAVYAGLQREIADVVESTREATARDINALMTATYWEIGRRRTGVSLALVGLCAPAVAQESRGPQLLRSRSAALRLVSAAA
ncbi:hypothetical protein SAMN05192563_102487 [Paraburkholderia aspalathi]|uniref:YhcG N-terminal domain-containing protein n=1 Tax=Paraburkholderia aspalathi TaxID=1324617 RepID=A0A1I7EJD2_9BURK|nr:hypothetical protein SAMN05192563_102487 [Paraburkholderia aspalathi]